jgi:cytochrome c553
LLKGGTRGGAVRPGQSAESLLYTALLRNGDLKMPPGKNGLSPEEIKTIADWIDAGAKWPDGTSAKPESIEPSWWSFRKLQRPSEPKVRDAKWVRTPVDAFILSKLESKGLKPVAPASKLTLARRAYFDLWGLPPTPQQLDEFLSDNSPDAWEKLVDTLLASPRYGERWGKYWLDLARYADSGGFEHDMYFPNAWRYRDYVIRSFNEDKPYRQFVQEQIAADEIWPDNLELAGTYELPAEKKKHIEGRIGTGFFTVGPWYPAAAIVPESLRADRLADMVDTMSSAFMGMTFGCARCHDHKFDPVPQRDYYRLAAIFAASEEREIPIVELTKLVDYQKHMPRAVAMDDLKAAIAKLDKKAKRTPLSDEEKLLREKYLRRIGEVYLDFPGHYPTANVLAHLEQVPDVHILTRGDYAAKGEKVGPGIPTLTGDTIDIDAAAPRRKALAEWLTKPDHPLTWRVMVNRLWQGHFGVGLVRSPNDFGRQGEAPTHPELLDWLAGEFVERGTSLKALHKLILTSSVYQLSSEGSAPNLQADPENRLLWRMNRRRLEAESLRDSVLAASGALNVIMYGPPVVPPLSPEEMQGIKETYMWPATVNPEQAVRRSVYLYIKRSFPMPLFAVFDSPDTSMSCGRRETTNVAPQALALLNNRLLNEQAGVMAARLRREAGEDVAAQVRLGWRIALGREPSSSEHNRALAMLHSGHTLDQFALLLFNLNEFLYID